MTTDTLPAEELFAVDFAALAREIAMDILPMADILKLHQLSDADWARIEAHPKFIEMLAGMISEWNATSGTKDRVKAKASTGLESVLEIYIRDISDPSIPLAQRVEAGKFLARLGELDGSQSLGGAGGGAFQIVINMGAAAPVTAEVIPMKTIEGTVIPEA